MRPLAPALALLLSAAAAPTLAQTTQAQTTQSQTTQTQAPGSLAVIGLDGHSETLTTAQLAARPHQSAALTHEGKTTVYSGVSLSEILHDIDAPMGARMHGQAVNDVILVTAADNYRVVLSLGEMDPGMHKGARAILADQADGKPLDAKEGPLRLVIDGDLKPARSERQVVRIELKHLP